MILSQLKGGTGISQPGVLTLLLEVVLFFLVQIAGQKSTGPIRFADSDVGRLLLFVVSSWLCVNTQPHKHGKFRFVFCLQYVGLSFLGLFLFGAFSWGTNRKAIF